MDKHRMLIMLNGTTLSAAFTSKSTTLAAVKWRDHFDLRSASQCSEVRLKLRLKCALCSNHKCLSLFAKGIARRANRQTLKSNNSAI